VKKQKEKGNKGEALTEKGEGDKTKKISYGKRGKNDVVKRGEKSTSIRPGKK